MGKIGASEEYFPRGKTSATAEVASPEKLKSTSSSVKSQGGGKEGRIVNLFSNKENKGTVNKNKKKNAKKGDKKGKKEKSIFSVKSVPSLAYSQLTEGMVILGVIGEVQDFELKVSLPGHLVGMVPITNISQEYTDYLRKAAKEEEGVKEEGEEGQEEEMAEVEELSSLFKVGQSVVVGVVSCSQSEDRNNHFKLTLSLDPRVVMGGRVPGVGELCVASVKSKEDHGYIMEVGNPSVRGFLPNKTANKAGTTSLVRGAVLLCQVTKKDVGALTLTCLPGKVFSHVQSAPTVHNIIPGTKFNGKVESYLENGLQVAIGGDLMGFIHRDLLPSPGDEVKSFPIGSEIPVRLEYIVPTLNTIILTARDICPPKNQFESLPVGTLIESATIVHVAHNYLVLDLHTQNLFGQVSARQTREGTEVIKMLREKFKVGERVRTRVMGVDQCSGVAICTMQKSKLAGVTSLDQLAIGQRVKATVKRFNNQGLEVQVGPSLEGFIPTLYLSDVLLKHPEKKYLPGDKLDCRVLRMNKERRRLHLTSKRILVREEFTVVSTYEEAVPGTVTEGVVTKISRDGLLVSLWGDMKGFAPKSALSTEVIDYPEKIFFIGQAVKCQITGCEPERKRISLSLVIGTMNPMGRKQKQKGRILLLGQMYSCKVTDVTEKGLDVEVTVDEQAVKCCVPLHHLTDNASMASILLTVYQPGDVFEALCCQHDVVPILTRKQSFITASQGRCPKSVEEVEVNDLFPAAVQAVKPYGAFVLPAWPLNKAVLVPTRLLADFFVEAPEDVLDIGQTLCVKIKEVSESDGKIVGSSSLKDVEPTLESSVQVLEGLLKDVAFIQKQKSDRDSAKGAVVRVGDLVSGVVRDVSSLGAVVTLTGNSQLLGICPGSGLGELTPAAGETVSAVVIFVDHLANCVEVSLDPSLVSMVTVARERPNLEAVVRGRVVLARTEHSYQIVAITHPPRLAGHLVYVPTRTHLNDLAGEDDALEEEAVVTVIVKSVTDDGQLIGIKEKHIAALSRKRKQNRRERQTSISRGEEARTIKRMRTESESSVAEKLRGKGADSSVSDSPVSEVTDLAALNRERKQRDKKLRKEERKAAKKAAAAAGGESAAAAPERKTAAVTATAGEVTEEEMAELEESVTEDREPIKPAVKPKQASLADPGWNLGLTSVTLPAWGRTSIWGDLEDTDEEAEDEEGSGRKHLSKKEAKALRRAESEAAEAEERRVVEGENLPPQTVQEFEKLVMSSPDSSLVWVQYMAFHLQSCQYEEARAVARRGVERINFREEGERLNLYLAWLNLENNYGTQETLNKVLLEAVQRNDEYKVYCQMAAIYAQSDKTEEAEKTYRVLVKKFGKEKEVWIQYGLFHFKRNRLEDGRFVLTRALQNLDKRDIVETTAKFAQIEFKYGESERGKTIYEKLVSNYPRRGDLWSSYADQLARTGDTTAARALYTRISTLGLQAKKMKPLFAKWLEFERVHGTEEQQNEVRKAALSFLHSKDAVITDPDMETD